MLSGWRTVSSAVLVLGLCLATVSAARAAGEFQENSVVTYEVKPSGTTEVTHKIDLINRESSVYAAGFALSLDGYLPSNVEAFDRGGKMAVSQQRIGQKTLLNLTFNDMAVGKGSDYSFTIRYNQSDIAKEKGQVWEVIIPKQADAFQSGTYVLKLEVPTSFGKASFISPSDYKTEEDGQTRVFIFDKKAVSQSRVVAAFGPVQVFDFSLRYHLQNGDSSPKREEIALPPDTTYQKVMFRSISPSPESVRVDEDGNWLATYYLAPLEKTEIEVNGSVEISSAAQRTEELTPSERSRYLMATSDWQVDDPVIQGLAKQLKGPKEIYDFVVSHLKYDYSRATIISEAKRLGAKGALENPDKAICTEFTDLFIALARAAGIPARELQGYAYTNDPQLQPLSLVRDVLHAWPEFWDDQRGEWVQVDPTWGNTTGGVDFFSKLDFNHSVFVAHGDDTSNPKPAGSYRVNGIAGRDVDVHFGDLQPFGKPKVDLYYRPGNFVMIPFLGSTGKLVVRNLGPISVSEVRIDLEGSGFESVGNQATVEVIPPYGSASFSVAAGGGPINFLDRKVLLSTRELGEKSTTVKMWEIGLIDGWGIAILSGLGAILWLAIHWRKKLLGVYFGRGKER